MRAGCGPALPVLGLPSGLHLKCQGNDCETLQGPKQGAPDHGSIRSIVFHPPFFSNLEKPRGCWVLGMKEQNNEVGGWFAAVAPSPLCPGSESFRGTVPRMQVDDMEGKRELPRTAAPASLTVREDKKPD